MEDQIQATTRTGPGAGAGAGAGADAGADPNQRGQSQISPSPFKCNVCQRTYARIDHLSRHFRLHTSERPYRCDMCFKTFNRPDLLKRHALGHIDSTRGHKAHPTRPRRVTQACKACAAAKLKCKEQKPCQRCVNKHIICEYTETDTRNAGNWQGQQSSAHDPVPQNIGNYLPKFTYTPYSTDNRSPGVPVSKNDQNAVNPVQSCARDDTSMVSAEDPSPELIECDESMLADFLRDVMMPTPRGFNSQLPPNYDTDSPAMAFKDLLSFGLESDLELNDEDYSDMNVYQVKDLDEQTTLNQISCNPTRYELLTPELNAQTQKNEEHLALGTKAFRSSLWCWTPVRADTGSLEQHNLTLQPSEMSSPDTHFPQAMAINTDHLNSAARDRFVAMILKTASRSSFEKVMSSFPSVELLDNLMHSFFASHIRQADTWIHCPTFKVGSQRSELLGSIISAGAVLSTSLPIRKLGFAIHEAVRHALPKVCEENNSVTRDLSLLQAMVLNLEVGLWSGNKRNIELAESHAGIVITMCRRASRFLRSSYRLIIPLETDEGEILEDKWRDWAYQESLKRLVFVLFTRDAQTSISFIVPTIISSAELSLPLPESRNLFLARTAEEWKLIYLSQPSSGHSNERIPSLQQYLHDITPLRHTSISGRIDTPMSLSIIAYGVWRQIFEYRQLNSITRAYPPSHLSHSILVLEHRHQELCQILHLFSVSLLELEPRNKSLSSTALELKMLIELLLTQLHVSFENLQLFAGREGEEEARRVYPSLLQWATSREARAALFHAGQVVRYAKLLNKKKGGLHGVSGFFAVAVYHAALAFWAFGILGLRPGYNHATQQPSAVDNANGAEGDGGNDGEELVWLDVEESLVTKSFIALGRGIACFSTAAHVGSEHVAAKDIARLCEPQKVMIAIVKILRGTCGEGDEETPPPPLVENLSQLIKELGNAAKDL